MKKKTVITVVIGVIIALTIITSIYGKNPIYNYVKNKYFPDVLNLEEQYGVKNYKTGNQTIEVDGYTMVMDQYFFESDKSAGYLRIKVMYPDLDMREMETDSGNDENLFNFGLDDTRYFFATDVKGEGFKEGITACTSYQKIRAIQTNKAMYIYFKFCSEDGGIYNGKVFLHDRKAQKGVGYSDYAGKEKYAIGVFDLTK
ncbi:hypothetical protein [Eubacterium sp.]|uniref:hypothetical protein n=1 Tax=Eubacterium sp. TaxID=142586 RepID=UPI00352290C2